MSSLAGGASTAGRRLGWGEAIVAAALVALGRPRIWLLSLAAFLVRGGILLVILPIVVVPTPSGFQNLFAESIVDVVFGRIPVGLVAIGLVVAVVAIGWLVLGGLVAARIDLSLVPEALADEDLDVPLPAVDLDERVWAALAARLVAHLPLAVALGFGVVRIYAALYEELLSPQDVVTPVALRVLRDVPEAVILIAVTWLGGEVVGGLATRELAAGGTSPGRALAGALSVILRRPLAVLGTTVVTTAALLVVAIPSLVAAGLAWERLGRVLDAGSDGGGTFVTLVAFVAIWIGGLVLVAAVVGWRQVAWTFEAFRVPGRTAGGARTGASTPDLRTGEVAESDGFTGTTGSGSL